MSVAEVLLCFKTIPKKQRGFGGMEKHEMPRLGSAAARVQLLCYFLVSLGRCAHRAEALP